MTTKYHESVFAIFTCVTLKIERQCIDRGWANTLRRPISHRQRKISCRIRRNQEGILSFPMSRRNNRKSTRFASSCLNSRKVVSADLTTSPRAKTVMFNHNNYFIGFADITGITVFRSPAMLIDFPSGFAQTVYHLMDNNLVKKIIW